MPAGELRETVIVQRPVRTADEIGAEVITWETVCTRRAKVEPIGGGEVFFGQKVKAGTTCVVEMRYVPGLTTDWRLLFKGRELNIGTAVDVMERGKKHYLECKENT